MVPDSARKDSRTKESKKDARPNTPKMAPSNINRQRTRAESEVPKRGQSRGKKKLEIERDIEERSKKNSVKVHTLDETCFEEHRE